MGYIPILKNNDKFALFCSYFDDLVLDDVSKEEILDYMANITKEEWKRTLEQMIRRHKEKKTIRLLDLSYEEALAIIERKGSG